MRTIEVCKGGTELGTLSFRNVHPAPAAGEAAAPKKSKRMFRCSPAKFVPKEVARSIADQFSAGKTTGMDADYAWST